MLVANLLVLSHKVSLSFVRREIPGVERLVIDVTRIALRAGTEVTRSVLHPLRANRPPQPDTNYPVEKSAFSDGYFNVKIHSRY